jgi:hypothetical protein
MILWAMMAGEKRARPNFFGWRHHVPDVPIEAVRKRREA